MGATLPGCPLFGVGRTRRLAWGVTYMKGDTIDYFIEDCRPGGSDRLAISPRAGMARFRSPQEEIQRKWGRRRALRVYSRIRKARSRSNLDGRGAGILSFVELDRQTRQGASRSIATWLDLIDCNNAAEAMDIVRECPQPTLYWVFADREGHIGLQGWRLVSQAAIRPSADCCPCRHGTKRTTGAANSKAYYLPRIYDPPEGFIATANENINAPGGPQVGHAAGARLSQAADRRAAPPTAARHARQTCSRCNTTSISLQARDLLEVFLPHLAGRADQKSAGGVGLQLPRRPASKPRCSTELYRNVLLEIFGEAPHREGGGIGWRRMLYLCSRVRFLDDGAHLDRSAAGERSFPLVERPAQGRHDPHAPRKSWPPSPTSPGANSTRSTS